MIGDDKALHTAIAKSRVFLAVKNRVTEARRKLLPRFRRDCERDAFRTALDDQPEKPLL